MRNLTNKPLVVNWHLLEACQFKCRYCYAEWDRETFPEVYKSPKMSEGLIEEIAILRNRNGIKKVRLSFAGGEPLLDKKLPQKVHYANQCGLDVSIISNGHLLKPAFLEVVAPNLDMLGISIDSFSSYSNNLIGRRTLTGKQTNYEQLVGLLDLAREINPDIKIKINTVVNRFNYDEDMSEVISRIRPDKWKALRVLPATEKSQLEAITDEQFEVFRKQHAGIECASFEDNDDMRNSYLMIDPYGCFFFNREQGLGYGYSDPILAIGIQEALAQVKFDSRKFDKRYLH